MQLLVCLICLEPRGACSGPCRNVYIHHGSISHLKEDQFRWEPKKVWDKRKIIFRFIFFVRDSHEKRRTCLPIVAFIPVCDHRYPFNGISVFCVLNVWVTINRPSTAIEWLVLGQHWKDLALAHVVRVDTRDCLSKEDWLRTSEVGKGLCVRVDRVWNIQIRFNLWT